MVEPAGINLITPLALVIAARTTARLMLINHDTTGNIRNQLVSHEKSDAMDARALALVASMAASGTPPRSLRPYNFITEEATTALRLHIDARRRLMKSTHGLPQPTGSHRPSASGRRWRARAARGSIASRSVR